MSFDSIGARLMIPARLAISVTYGLTRPAFDAVVPDLTARIGPKVEQ